MALSTLAFTACNADAAKDKAKANANAGPVTEDEKTLYAIGVYLSKQVEPFALKPEEVTQVQKGFADGVAGNKPVVTIEEYIPKIQALQMARMQATSEKVAGEETAYLDKTQKETGATKTASGMLIKHTQEGKGASPAATDQVSVNYAGRFTSGEEFDSSVKNGGPVTFPLDRVIPCWTEGLQLMKVGGKAQLVCPSGLAYGQGGKPPTIPANSTLLFDVELLEIVKAPPPPK
ncbi:MAG TPA: FKBP-type peptidyl-prolyl cis-trans isomerase [Steroidobacteraceae bacterium]|nr:FKBP-type peptidyl-prolyl cis-trans isomerase [Steroidobacteraceae bacterium]